MKTNNRFTTELFNDRDSAEKAYQDALESGYTKDDVNVIMSEDSKKKYYDSTLVRDEDGDKSMEGLSIGGALGGVIGGTIAAIAAIGTSVIFPGLGLIVAGPLAAGLAGAGAGSISGGLIGSLIGWGIPEARAKEYEAGIKSGGIVLGVNEPEEDTTDLENKWRKYRNPL